MAPAPCLVSRSVARRSLRAVAAGLVLLALLAGCATRRVAPIEDRNAGAMLPAPSAQAVPPTTGATTAPSAAEPDWRPPTYTVKRGDTLHAIALDHGLDYRDIAAWNNIENPNRIEIGQVLRLGPIGEPPGTASASGGVVTAPLRSAPPVIAQGSPTTAAAPSAASRNTENYKSQPKLFKEPYSEQALRDAQRAAAIAPPSTVVATTAQPPAAIVANVAPPVASVPSEPVAAKTESKADARPESKPEAKPEPKAEPRGSNASAEGDERVQWAWPASGKVIAGFSETANLKGIDIGGAAGTPVVASAAGKVVYAGSGLRGYGKLIIVKHNATYLSAYAHNREILVKEGQQVGRGQKIAEMGNTDANDVKLHFEIRRLGKPVDPLKYLPPV